MIPYLPSPGEPFNFSAEVQKQYIDAVRDLREKQFHQSYDTNSRESSALGNQIQAVNATENLGDIPWYGIVKLKDSLRDGTIVSDTESHSPGHGFENQIVFEVESPSGFLSEEIIGITQSPMAFGEVGNVLVDGVTQVRILVDSETIEYRYAMTDADNVNHLVATEFGPIEILWMPSVSEWEASGVSIVWGIVRLPMRPASLVKWGLVQSEVCGSTAESSEVTVRACDPRGLTANYPTDTFSVWTPRHLDHTSYAIYPGLVVGYVNHIDPVGFSRDYIITYIYDLPVGSILHWVGGSGAIPSNGWEEYTLAAGRYLRGRDPNKILQVANPPAGGVPKVDDGNSGGDLRYCGCDLEVDLGSGAYGLTENCHDNMDPWLACIILERVCSVEE